ncbi:MAG: ABC transporter ATP-binding protein [Clostridia bacterium]|nr:ABC transporter ATP-binding protein [Clostridia bacterium]
MKRIKLLLNKIRFMFTYSWKMGPANLICAFFQIIIDTAEPFLLLMLPKYIIDALVYGAPWSKVLFHTLLYIGVFALSKITRLIYNSVSAHIVNGCDIKNSLNYFSDYLYMDYQNLESDDLRNTNNRVSTTVRANTFVYEIFVQTITNFLKFIGYSYIIASLHPLLIIFLLGLVLINSLLSKKSEKINYEFEPVTARFSRKQSYLFGTMIGFDWAKEVRINKAEEWLREKHGNVCREYMSENMKLQKKHLPLNVISSIVSFAETFVTYVYCALMAITGSITIGSFSVYVGAIANFSSSLNAVVQSFVHNSYVMKRIDEYQDYRNRIKPFHESTDPETSPALDSAPSIEFVNVSFRYPNTDFDVLKNISLKIEAGKRLAIVGYNGAGKTTLIKLLCRLYEPTEGEILYNGINIKNIRYKEYMDILSVVLQDFKLFAFPVWENIVLNRQMDKEHLEYCIDKCGLMNKINSLPKGLETSIGREFDEEGIEFSGGEGQKLASARALYKKGKISIMDEPTSALDPIAEYELYNRFDQIIMNNTALYVSHRLASAKFCDRIAVFAGGRIIEEGTHDELIGRNGVYCEMFNKQAEYYREETGK